MPQPLQALLLVSTILLLHAYLRWRLLPGPWFAQGRTATGLAVASALLVSLGLLARFYFPPPHSEWLSWPGLILAAPFLFTLLAVPLRDLVIVAGRLLPLRPMQEERRDALWKLSSAGLLTLSGGLTAAGLRTARGPATVFPVTIPLTNLPVGWEGARIVQLSDIHLGPTIKGDFLRRIVEQTNELAPDLVVITGDLFDGPCAQLATECASLGKLRAPLGVYFVTGNHEYYWDLLPSLETLRQLGVRVLNNEHVVLERGGTRLLLAGITDYNAGRYLPAHRSDPWGALDGAPEEPLVRVLLAHQPRSAAQAEAAGFDLQLSGHTHGGQFFPWNHFVKLEQPFAAGLGRLGKLWVYTSRGTGYWGPPVRTGVESEITCLTLTRSTRGGMSGIPQEPAPSREELISLATAAEAPLSAILP